MSIPIALSAEYRRSVRTRLPGTAPLPLVAEADLAKLPAPVGRYLRRVGALGRPRPTCVRARWRGRIRSGRDAPWMRFTAEQHNFLSEPARFFLMSARRAGLPVSVFHAYDRESAAMQARLFSLVPVMRASGPELHRAETVTVLNDVCLLAPGALVGPEFAWEAMDDAHAQVRYTVGDSQVTAELRFDAAGDLVDFVSDDRLATVEGGAFESRRWSTPVGSYRSYGPVRALGRGEGRWHDGVDSFAYIELELIDLRVGGAEVATA